MELNEDFDEFIDQAKFQEIRAGGTILTEASSGVWALLPSARRQIRTLPTSRLSPISWPD
jgi:hypothetical protein